ncbi:hypothetical protein [Aeromonas dhakensis]|uniref:hypothetical protein n=1 Tax=Aeromonas dhakensis TaxID=196024 RepID=UPI00244AD61B|nr:hypothetical protein [Aeromonas dhakensis]MDH0348178.1 hypothetical protein [Aeromonas dhakensis]
MSNMQAVEARAAQIENLSGAVAQVCIHPQLADGQLISDTDTRLSAIAEAAKKSPMFDSLGSMAPMVATAWATSINCYFDSYNTMPSKALLASAAQSLANITVDIEGAKGVKMLDSVRNSLNTSEGVEIRAKQAALILPTLLMCATSDAVTYIPAQANEVEIFDVRRVAASKFGDYAVGDVLNNSAFGQYSSLNQIYAFPEGQQPDGTKKSFVYDSAVAGFHIAVPFKKASAKLWLDGNVVASEVEGQVGKLYGTTHVDGVEVVINGAITANTGKVELTTTAPLKAGQLMLLEYDVDIEKSPELIPVIANEMQPYKLRPHESALAAEHTVQAYWTMNREFGIDTRSMQMSELRNFLAYEKDVRNLRKMILAMSKTYTFNLKIEAGQYFKEHYETLHKQLLLISQDMQVKTQVSGLVGMFCGPQACAVIKSLGAPHFQMVEGYRQVPRVHYVGKLFGQFKIYEVPVEIEVIKGVPSTKLGTFDCLCYARGEGHAEAGLVVGDAVPATIYNHNVNAALKDRNTIWELSYCDIHPKDGSNFFARLSMIPA